MNKIKIVEKMLPLVAQNADFVDSYENLSEVEVRGLINQLATGLDPDVWINLFGVEFDMAHIAATYDKNIQTVGGNFKPNGLYLSKGDWLFHEISNITNTDHTSYLNFVKVDYTNIKIITSIEQLEKFTDKYSLSSTDSEYFLMDWYTVANKYDGICIIPGPGVQLRKKYDILKPANKLLWAYMLDVSTLVLWSPKPIISSKSYQLTHVGLKIINEEKFLRTMVKRIIEKATLIK